MPDILDQILHKLPSNKRSDVPEQIRVLTIRLPASLHEELKEEARLRKTSANQLAIAKLAIKSEVLDKVVAEMQGE